MTTSTIDESQRKAAKVAGFTCLFMMAACIFVFVIFSGFAKVVNLWWFDSPMGVFEMALSFWLMFKGLIPYRRERT